MEILFLDTSIWESNNFLESRRINQLLKLSRDGQLRIILPQLTYDEILNRIKKNAIEACLKVKKLRNEARILRNIPELNTRFEELDTHETTEKLQKIFAEKLVESNVEIIDYPTISIQGIFNSYFNKKFPFGSAGKKDEFPDAFALICTEEWAIDENEEVITFAKDKDILGYESKKLKIHESFEDYITNKLKEIDKINIECLKESFLDNKQNLESEISNWIHSQLDDYSKYYYISNYSEVHDIEIQLIEVELDAVSITSVEDSYITFQSKAIVNFEVEIVIDDENYMVKDDDTKSWVAVEWKTETVEEEKEILVEFRYDKAPIDEYYGEIIIEVINKGESLII